MSRHYHHGTTQTMMVYRGIKSNKGSIMQYKLPIRFYDDRLDRELFDGIEIKRTKSYIVLELTDTEKAEYLSDALYYAEGYPDDAPKGVTLSAIATVKILRV